MLKVIIPMLIGSVLLIMYRLSLHSSQIVVHLVPHSHDDVGWLKTPEQYFFGMRQDIQRACVRDTITKAIEQLANDPKRKFIQVEMAFFRMWWENANDQQRDIARHLIENHQFEFTNGGVSMNDEATTYYEDIIDNMSWGHQWILENFGKDAIPTIGWQIDPFGHSQSQASLFSQMGFDGWFFARMDYQDRDKRNKEKSLEFFTCTPQDNNILTHVLFNHYSSPPGFSFDEESRDDQITDQNVRVKSRQFVDYFKEMSIAYNQTVLMHVMGDDFWYSNATKNYQNMDQLINYVNKYSSWYNMKIQYSTPAMYLADLQKLKKDYQEKTDDFFPYGDSKDSYWSGYFTSRPATKLFVKETGRFLQIAKTFFSYLNQLDYGTKDQNEKYSDDVSELEYTSGILQHHDAVSGTAKQAVTWNYNFLLDTALSTVKQNVYEVLKKEDTKMGYHNEKYQFCGWNTTYTSCQPVLDSLKDQSNLFVNAYNPGADGNFTLRVKVNNQGYQVYDLQNNLLPSDVICPNKDLTDCDLYFFAHLESLVFTNFIIKQEENKNLIQRINLTENLYQLSDSMLMQFSINDLNGRRHFKLNQNGKSQEIQLQYGYYESFQEDDSCDSGAYDFRTDAKTYYNYIPYGYSTQTSFDNHFLFQGQVVSVASIIDEKLSSQVKVFLLENQVLSEVVEVETLVNSIDISDGQGKEVVVAFTSQVDNQNTFVTDSNGLYFQERKINFRPSWDLQVVDYVPQNYYPVNAIIGVESESSSFYVLPDRSQGGSSLQPGQIELMIHRRLLRDDDKGVGEPLNEIDVDGEGLKVRCRHWIVGKDREEARRVQYRLDLQPWVVLAKQVQSNTTLYGNLTKTTNDFVEREQIFRVIPAQTEFLKTYLRHLSDNKYLLRFHNMHEFVSLPLDLNGLDVEETQLTGVKTLDEVSEKKIVWSNGYKAKEKLTGLLEPQEIRSFILTVQKVTNQ